jgi:predicted PurR-regulated permease PerM
LAGGIFVYLLLLTLLTGFVLLLFPLIAEQSGKIAASVPGYYQSFRDWMMGNSNPLIEQLSEFLPENLSIPGLAQQTGQQMLDSAGQALGYDIGRKHPLYGYGCSAIGLLLDTLRPAHHPILATAGSHRPA